MNPQKAIQGLLLFVLGLLIGLFSREITNRSMSGNNTYFEKHEGSQRLINPLLSCDSAEDMLQNRELGVFKEKIDHFLKGRMDKRWATRVSVYFRELNDGLWFSIGDVEKFIPASLRKVPLMIALLKQAEQQQGLLERIVKFDLANDYNINQNIKPAETLVFGKAYSVRELIYRMIVYSDNNAFTFLTKIVSPAELDSVYNNLRILNPKYLKDDEFMSVQTYESFFRVLYNATYLSREASSWALDTLAKSDFKSGLVAGVPSTVKIAHKFGEKSDAETGTVQFHDCGIVYHPQHPYLLCIMSQGTDFNVLDDVIAEISRITYTEIDSQQRSNLPSQ